MKESPQRDSHHPRSSEDRHVAQYMGRIETLLADGKFQFADEEVSERIEQIDCQRLVIVQPGNVAFDGPLRDLKSRFEVEGVLDIAAKQDCFVCLRDSPVVEFANQEQAAHGRKALWMGVPSVG